jgi:hypothetical protein
MCGVDHTGKQGAGGEFAKQAVNWNTPTASDVKPSLPGRLGRETETLRNQALDWPSPNAHDASGARGKGFELTDGHTRPHDLVAAVKAWPSPRSEDSESCGNHPGEVDSLTGAARQWQAEADSFRSHGGDHRLWSSPKALTGGANSNRAARGAGGADLQEQSQTWFSHPDPTNSTSGPMCWCGAGNCGLPSHKRRLNPLFATWLMGWPQFCTASEPISFAPLEMEWWRSQQQSLLWCLLGELGLSNKLQNSAVVAVAS